MIQLASFFAAGPPVGPSPRSISLPRSGSVTGLLCGEFLLELSDDIRAFAGSWPRFCDLGWGRVAAHPFQCRDHLEVWLETIGAANGIRPLFAQVSNRRGGPVMLLPLGIRKRGGTRILEFLDAGVADYNAPALYPAAGAIPVEEMQKLWAALCRAAPPFDVVMLDKMPERVGSIGNPLFALASERWPAAGHVMTFAAGASLASLQHRRERNDSARQRRRLSEIGAVTFGTAREESEIAKVFDAFVRQKFRRYQETIGTAGFDVLGQRDYYRLLTERFAGQGVELWYLAVGAEPVATAWGFLAGRCLYYMMCAYEGGEWRRFSPGRLLLEELIDWSCRNNVAAFDFGIGDEAYKFAWPQTNVALARFTQPRTLRGRTFLGALGLRRELKRRAPRDATHSIKSLLGL